MRVLVTRPEPGAGKTAELLRQRSHDPVVLPLSRTVALAGSTGDPMSGDAGALAVTSAAALRHWQALGIEPERRAVPVYAVGEATGRAARKAGFRDVRTGSGTGADLAAKIAGDIASGHIELSDARPLLYAAGRARHGGFEAAIEASAIPLKVAEIYDIEEISYSTDFVLRLFSVDHPVAVLFYSRNAATLFFALIADDAEPNQLENSVFLCMSEDIAVAVPDRFKEQTRVAADPREENLLSLLPTAARSR